MKLEWKLTKSPSLVKRDDFIPIRRDKIREIRLLRIANKFIPKNDTETNPSVLNFVRTVSLC